MLQLLERSLKTAHDDARMLTSRKARRSQNPMGMALDTAPNYGEQNQEATNQYKYHRGRVFSAIRVIAQRIACQPVVVARIGKPVDKSRSLAYLLDKGWYKQELIPGWMKRYTPDNLEVLQSHPLLDTLDDPNELMVRSVLWYHTVANLEITGRSLWILSQNKGKYEIIPIPTTWATPDHGVNGQSLYANWLIKPPGAAGEPISIRGDFVANFYIPNPEDPFGCISPLQMAARSILADEAISVAQEAAFRNGINPSVAVIAGDATVGDGKRQIKLEPHQRRQLISWLRQEYEGAAKFGRPMVMDAMIKDVKSLSVKNIEMAFMESAGLTKSQIYETFGVNPISAGQVEGSNRASSGIADHHLVVNALQFIVEMMSQVITAWVVPFFSGNRDNLKAWLVMPEAYQPDLEIEKWNIGRQMYATTRNDFRTKALGLSPIVGWDDVVVPITFQSVQAGAAVEPVTGSGTHTEPQPREARRRFIKSYSAAWLKMHGHGEAKFRDDLQELFKLQREAVEKRLSETTVMPVAEQLFNPADWTETLKRIAHPHLQKQAIAGASMTLALHETEKAFGFDLPQRVLNWIWRQIDEILIQPYWHGVNETTLTSIRDALQTGVEEGGTVPEISRRVLMALDDEHNLDRASNIARTETTNAMNAGHAAAHDELAEEGISYGLEWIDMHDSVTRDTHYAMHEVKVRNGEMFNVGGFLAPYPGHHSLPAKERCQCRCSTVEVLEPF